MVGKFGSGSHLVIVIDSARRLVACCHQDLLVEQVERRPRNPRYFIKVRTKLT